MTLLFSTSFRLLLWVLLTGDLKPLNLVIGMGVALLLPRDTHAKEPLIPFLRALATSLVAIPIAYGEALALMVASGREQVDCTQRQISAHASSRVVVLELLVTLHSIIASCMLSVSPMVHTQFKTTVTKSRSL